MQNSIGFNLNNSVGHETVIADLEQDFFNFRTETYQKEAELKLEIELLISENLKLRAQGEFIVSKFIINLNKFTKIEKDNMPIYEYGFQELLTFDGQDLPSSPNKVITAGLDLL